MPKLFCWGEVVRVLNRSRACSLAQAPATKGHRSEAGAMLRPHLMLTATAGGGDYYDAHFTDGEPGDQRSV